MLVLAPSQVANESEPREEHRPVIELSPAVGVAKLYSFLFWSVGNLLAATGHAGAFFPGLMLMIDLTMICAGGLDRLGADKALRPRGRDLFGMNSGDAQVLLVFLVSLLLSESHRNPRLP